ncbi:MAG: class I SAM-dependent methyltransferase, partial [Chloroflexi bacterium]|nr:class I SAM-dependent methyltransferase [Chloroflexota bacterium]
DSASRLKLIRLYERSLKRYGTGAQALRWNTERSQRTRFEVLAEVGPWEGASVADIGCGLGDLFGFLRARGLDINYAGYDITPAMIDAARRKYPDPAARFELREILSQGMGGEFDYVVASGTFNIRVSNHDQFFRRMIAAMYAGCRRAVAFNVLQPAPYSDWKGGDMYYEIPAEEVVEYCRTLCPRVRLREGYLPWDTTVYLYKDPELEPRSAQ